MKLQEKYFSLIKSGLKTIELRLFDEKRKEIKIGDIIEFANCANKNETIRAKVIHLYMADNFTELCSTIKISQTGFKKINELPETIKLIYPEEKQNKYGVVGIEIKKL